MDPREQWQFAGALVIVRASVCGGRGSRGRIPANCRGKFGAQVDDAVLTVHAVVAVLTATALGVMHFSTSSGKCALLVATRSGSELFLLRKTAD